MKNTSRTVSIVLPTFNEAGNIHELLTRLDQTLRDAGGEAEILVVDDNSPDQTWRIAGEVVLHHAIVRVIRRLNAPGLRASIQDGIDAAKNEIVIWLDADMSHPPEAISQLLFMMGQGFDIVVNSRYVVGGSEVRSGKGGLLQLVLSRALNWTVRFMLVPSFSDYTSGFVAVDRSVLREVRLRGDYGEYFVDFAYRVIKMGYRVCELPFEAPPRKSGFSKTGAGIKDYMRRGVKYLAVACKVRVESMLGKHVRPEILAATKLFSHGRRDSGSDMR